VTRFSSPLDLLRLRGHDGGSRLSTGRDTCFVNIVWHCSEEADWPIRSSDREFILGESGQP